MNKQQAISSALRKARKFPSQDWCVVAESGEYDSCNEYDLDTFYLGAQVICFIVNNEVWTDGRYHQAEHS